MSFVRAIRATSRRTGSKPAEDDGLGRVVDDQVDAGRLLEGPDVAALAADDPALHLVVRQVDDRHRVLRGVVGGDALDRGDHDVAGLLVGLVAGLALDRPGELDRVVLGLLADGLEEERLGVLGRHAADPLERRDLLLVGLRDGPPGPASSSRSRSRSLRSRCSSMSVRWSSCSSRWRSRRSSVDELVALRPGLVLRLALEAELLVLRLEDQLLLAGARLGLDPARLGLGRLHRLRGPVAAGKHANDGSSDGRDHGHRNENQRFHSSSSRPVASRPEDVVRSERLGRAWGRVRCCLGDAPPAFDRAVFFVVGAARAAQLLSVASLRPCWFGGQTRGDSRKRGSGAALRDTASSVPRRESEGRTISGRGPWRRASPREPRPGRPSPRRERPCGPRCPCATPR